MRVGPMSDEEAGNGYSYSTLSLPTHHVELSPSLFPVSYRPLFNIPIIRSISICWPAGALLLSSSSIARSFAFSASSPALLTMPHFSHISMRSLGGRDVHLGMKTEASLGLPEARRALKYGCVCN